MKQLSLTAMKRDKVKTNTSHKLKKEGRVPAVMYGPGKPNMNLSLNTRDVLEIINDESATNAIINLTIENDNIQRKVMLKDYQVDPVKNKLLHVDLYEISMDKEMTVTVPIHLVGRPKGLADGGILEQKIREVEIRCLPDRIPEYIEVDVSALGIGDNLHLSDVKFSDDIKVLTDLSRTVAVVTIVEEEKPAAEEGAVEGAEATTGAAATSESAEKSSSSDSEVKK